MYLKSGTYLLYLAMDSTYPKIMGRFYYNYSMLVVNSFGLQNAMERSAVDIGHFFARCHSSATVCATITRDELAPRDFLKYSPDSHFVMISYAVLSLLKVSVFYAQLLWPDLCVSWFGRNSNRTLTTNRKHFRLSRTSQRLWTASLRIRTTRRPCTVAY